MKFCLQGLMPYLIFSNSFEDLKLKLVKMMMHFATCNILPNIQEWHLWVLLYRRFWYLLYSILLMDLNLHLFGLKIVPIIFYVFLMCLFLLLMVFGFSSLRKIGSFSLGSWNLRNDQLASNCIHNIYEYMLLICQQNAFLIFPVLI